MSRKIKKYMAAALFLLIMAGNTQQVSYAAALDESSRESEQGVSEADIRVVGYEIKDVKDGHQLPELKAGDKALVKVTVCDERARADQLAFAGAKINTEAFRTVKDLNENHSDKPSDMKPEKRPGYGDAFVENIVEAQKMYTLCFYVNYTGAGKNFDFDLFYHTPSAALKMEKISLVFHQCKLSADNEDQNTSGDTGGDLSGGAGNSSGGANEDTTGGGEGVSLTATKLFVQGFEYGETMPKAGDNIELKIKIGATSGSFSIQNVRVTAEFPETVTLLKNTNMYHIGTIGAGGEAFAIYSIGIADEMRGDACEIKLTMKGVDGSGTEMTTEEVIELPIMVSEQLEIESVSIPQQINTVYDDESGISEIILENRGTAAAKVVGIEVEGEGLELSEKEGDEALQKSESEIEAGERKTFTINLRPKKEGELSAVVTVRYKGSDGSEKTLQKEVKTKGVQMKAEVSQNVTIDKELIEEEENYPAWTWLIAAAGILLGIYVALRIIYDRWRTDKKRKEI